LSVLPRPEKCDHLVKNEEHTLIAESAKCCATSQIFLKFLRIYQYFDRECGRGLSKCWDISGRFHSGGKPTKVAVIQNASR
jgi:hypothetical protein